MKAVVGNEFGGPEVLHVEEIPMPQAGTKEVLIRVHAAGVNPVDTYIRAGYFAQTPAYAKLPFVPGFDVAGIVEAIGPGVTKFKKGDRVWTNWPVGGAYAQYTAVPEKNTWRLPASLTFQQGAAVGVPYFTAYHSLFQTGKPKSAKTVLVHGASGGVGLASVQMAKEAGMTVYGTAGTEGGLKLVRDAGADGAFNHRDADYVNKIKEATNGEGVDLILEMIADVNWNKDMELIKKRGIIAVIGSRATVEIRPGALIGNEAKVVGVSILDLPNDELTEAGTAIVRGLANGHLIPIIDKEYSMDNAAVAHKEIIESSGAKGKLIINIG